MPRTEKGGGAIDPVPFCLFSMNTGSPAANSPYIFLFLLQHNGARRLCPRAPRRLKKITIEPLQQRLARGFSIGYTPPSAHVQQFKAIMKVIIKSNGRAMNRPKLCGQHKKPFMQGNKKF